jgi:hypothetical protein
LLAPERVTGDAFFFFLFSSLCLSLFFHFFSSLGGYNRRLFYAIILFWLMWQCAIGGRKCGLLRTDRTEDILYNELSMNAIMSERAHECLMICYTNIQLQMNL